jgi:NitT/TauT family transport system ATP-binding protein
MVIVNSKEVNSVRNARREAAGLPILSTDKVGFTYPNGLRAVNDVSFDLLRGEIVAVVGPSGCGKSTLLRMIAGLELPTDGDVSRNLEGTDKDGQRRHPCTMVFQEDTLLPWLKVRQNVELSFRFQRKGGTEVREHVNRLLQLVGLEEFGDYFPLKLSGGMKRRVAVLTAIAPLPEILLLDEPFSALDEPTRIAVHDDLHQLIRNFGISALLVTHDLGEAITLADRVLLLSRGPGRIVGEFVIPFGRDRAMLDLRDRPEFLELYGSLWHDLKAEITSAVES